jgi:hypothetical protein
MASLPQMQGRRRPQIKGIFKRLDSVIENGDVQARKASLRSIISALEVDDGAIPHLGRKDTPRCRSIGTKPANR